MTKPRHTWGTSRVSRPIRLTTNYGNLTGRPCVFPTAPTHQLMTKPHQTWSTSHILYRISPTTNYGNLIVSPCDAQGHGFSATIFLAI